jgi:allantoin racemase
VKIWFQKHTIEGRLPFLDGAYRRHVGSVLDSSGEVHFASLPEGTYEHSLPADYVRYGSVEAMFSWFFAAQAVTAENSGYDAYVIGTSQDPGLREARALATIPVLGYGETAFFACAQRSLPFAVIGCIPELEEPIAANIERYGLRRWLVGFSYLEDGPSLIQQALEGDQEEFLRRFANRTRDLIKLGARVIIPGEGLPNEVLFAAGISEIDGIPVLDANGLLLKSAEHQVQLADLGVLRLPTEGYEHRRLPQSERRRLFDVFAPPTIPREGSV